MRLVYDWGVNDADYVVRRCPIYHCWKNMIKRCRCPKAQMKRPTYIGCKVDEQWKYFMVFQAWYLNQNPKLGEQLDKDFLGDGKLYSPETCCFIPRWLNNLFTDSAANRGKNPQGVHFNKRDRKYQANIHIRGRLKFLGYFDTPEEASVAYLEAKAAYVEGLLIEFPQPPRLEASIRCKMIELIEFERNVSYEPTNR